MGWPGWLFVAQSAAGMIFYLAALRNTSVANVAVIHATSPFTAAARESRASVIAVNDDAASRL